MKSLAIIGAGAIAQTYMQAVDTMDGVRIGAVCDINPAIRDSVAERLGCPAYETIEEAIVAERPDGVIVTAPPMQHPALAVPCLKAGIPVLCEKPLTIDLDSANRMIAAARKHGTLLAMASKFRYVEDIIKAKSLLESDVIGKIQLVENLFAASVDMSSRWNSNPDISGGGVLIDNGTHSVEVVRYLAGPIRRVRAITETYGRSMPVEDAAILFVETERGIRGHIELSWAIAKKSPAWVTVYGTKGVLEVGWQQSRYKRDEDNDWTVFGTGYDKVDSFRRNIADFIAGIDGKALMRTTLDDALASVRVIEAAYASAESGGWVDVAADRHLTAIDGSKEKRA